MVIRGCVVWNAIRSLPLRRQLHTQTHYYDLKHHVKLPQIPQSQRAPPRVHKAHAHNQSLLKNHSDLIHQISNLTGSKLEERRAIDKDGLQGSIEIH